MNTSITFKVLDFIDIPYLQNKAAIKCYQSLGFKPYQMIETTDAMNRPAELMLMLLARKEKE